MPKNAKSLGMKSAISAIEPRCSKKPEMKNTFITSVTFKLPKKWEPVISYKDLREHLQSNHAPELHPTDIYNP